MSPSLLVTAAPTPAPEPPRLLFHPADPARKRTTVFCAGGLALTALTATPDARPDDEDGGTASNRASERDDAPSAPRRTVPACPWTGAPIRAIVPLPRRALCASGAPTTTSTSTTTTTTTNNNNNVAATTAFAIGPRACHTTHLTDVWDDVDTDSTDSSGSEWEERHQDRDTDGEEDEDEDEDEEAEEEEEEEGEREDGGCDGDASASRSRSRHCSYESITAAQGLAAWSFEELRVECYAQSLVARGTKPPPVDQPSLAIPPAFVPRVVRLPRS